MWSWRQREEGAVRGVRVGRELAGPRLIQALTCSTPPHTSGLTSYLYNRRVGKLRWPFLSDTLESLWSQVLRLWRAVSTWCSLRSVNLGSLRAKKAWGGLCLVCASVSITPRQRAMGSLLARHQHAAFPMSDSNYYQYFFPPLSFFAFLPFCSECVSFIPSVSCSLSSPFSFSFPSVFCQTDIYGVCSPVVTWI